VTRQELRLQGLLQHEGALQLLLLLLPVGALDLWEHSQADFNCCTCCCPMYVCAAAAAAAECERRRLQGAYCCTSSFTHLLLPPLLPLPLLLLLLHYQHQAAAPTPVPCTCCSYICRMRRRTLPWRRRARTGTKCVQCSTATTW
jgi:hypothetical protein